MQVFASTSAAAKGPYPDLIKRYNLQAKLHDVIEVSDESTEKESGSTSADAVRKAKWSQSKEERQAMLRKQREDMILRARRKLEEEDKKANATA
jgi:coupling of ubiquitin conjugation to ER degradation protein 1